MSENKGKAAQVPGNNLKLSLVKVSNTLKSRAKSFSKDFAHCRGMSFVLDGIRAVCPGRHPDHRRGIDGRQQCDGRGFHNRGISHTLCYARTDVTMPEATRNTAGSRREDTEMRCLGRIAASPHVIVISLWHKASQDHSLSVVILVV